MNNNAIKNALKNRRLSKITISIGDDGMDDGNKDLGLAPETPDSKQHIEQGEKPEQVRQELMHPDIESSGLEVDSVEGDADYLSPELIAKSTFGDDPNVNLGKKSLGSKAREKAMAKLNKGKNVKQ